MRKWTEKPWERQTGESEKAFEAFVVYRDLGQDRTITAVGKRLAKSRNLIDRWKEKYNWSERVRLYDNELEKRAMAKAVKERKAMTERHIKLAMQMQKKALEALQALNKKDMSPWDIKEYIKIATEIERLNRTDSSEKNDGIVKTESEFETSTLNLSMLSNNELEVLNELADKIITK